MSRFKLPLSILLITLSVVFLFLGNRNFKSFDFGEKLWIHHMGEPENTMEGFQKTIEQGYTGIECDVFYEKQNNQFILSHDWPPQENAISLDTFLAASTASDYKLWIDLKNASLSHIFATMNRFKDLEKKYNLKGRYFVESTHRLHQIILSWYGINASMWVRSHSKSRISLVRNIQDRLTVFLGNFIAVSMPMDAHSLLSKYYKSAPKLIFTVNDPEQQRTYLTDPTIHVVLKDLEAPQK